MSVLSFSQYEGRKYCEHDFQMLFAPCCHQCGECHHIQPIQIYCRPQTNNHLVVAIGIEIKREVSCI